MKKRLLSLLLSAALLCGALPTAFAGYENFTPKTTYTDGRVFRRFLVRLVL